MVFPVLAFNTVLTTNTGISVFGFLYILPFWSWCHLTSIFIDLPYWHHIYFMVLFCSCSEVVYLLIIFIQIFLSVTSFPLFYKIDLAQNWWIGNRMQKFTFISLYFLDWLGDWDIVLQLYHFSFPRTCQNALYVSLNNSRAKRSLRDYLSPYSQRFIIKKFRLKWFKSEVTNSNIYMIQARILRQ